MSDEIDMSRLGSMKGHPNAPVNEKEIDAWVSRIDDVSNAIADFLQSDPDELERRREARRKEIADRERELKKQQIQERYNVAFYRKYEDDKFIDELLANVDKKENEEEGRKKKAIQVSKEHQMTDFERIALEEARKTRLRANDLVVKQNFNEAHELYTTIISLNPDDDALILAARNNRALTSLKLSPAPNYTQAVEDATFVIARDAKNVKARLRRAAAFLNGLHRPKEAIEDLRVVIKCDSSIKEAKDLMIAAQREAEENDAADRVTIEDKEGCEKFCRAMDALAGLVMMMTMGASALEKTFQVIESDGKIQKSADSEVSKFCRTLLEHLIVLRESVSLDDAFSSMFRLKDGFGVVVKICSTLANALIFETNEAKKFCDVTEAILVLSASLRLLGAVLNVDRTANALFANTPLILKEIFEICVKILQSSLATGNNNNNNNNNHRLISIFASSMDVLSHIINNPIFETTSTKNYSWQDLPNEVKSSLISVIIQNQNQNHNNNSPLLSDTMLLSAAVMLSDQGANDVMAKMKTKNDANNNKISLGLFSQLDSIASQQDYSSARAKSAATLLLRISSKKEIAVDISKNLEKLIKMLSAIIMRKHKNNQYNLGINFGILSEGLLSALHNAIVLQSVQRSDLAKVIASYWCSNPNNTSPSSSSSFIIPQIFEIISNNIDSVVNTYSAVVSKFFALVAKSLTSGTPEAEIIAKNIAHHQNSVFFPKMITSLARATLSFINEKRTERAKKIADSENISDLNIVQKTADAWIGGLNDSSSSSSNVNNNQNNNNHGGGLSQVNLLENITLIVAALFQVNNAVDFSKFSAASSLPPPTVSSIQVQLAKLAFDMISDMSFCAPRVSGNAAMWITSKLALDPIVVKYWTTADEKIIMIIPSGQNSKNNNNNEIENPKVRAEKLIKILLSGVKDISSLMYDVERSGGSGGDSKNSNKSLSEEQQHQRTMFLTTLKGARRNVAVAAAKLCAVEGGLFVEEFRTQGGTQLFGSLQIS